MNNIESKIDDLFDDIEKSNLYKDYKRIKKQLENDKTIMNLIEDIKKYQKLAINNRNDNSVEEKLKKLYEKLESYPIYQSYLIVKEELNQQLFEVKETFEKYFKDILSING